MLKKTDVNAVLHTRTTRGDTNYLKKMRSKGGDALDSIPRYEFHEIFDRVSANIDLEGCTSALAIEEKMEEVRGKCKAKSKINRTKTGRARYGRRASWLDNLIENDFAGRTIFEARSNPRGLIALTLTYGRQEAQQRILAQRKAAIRSRLAYGVIPRVARTVGVSGVPRRPEFSRIPTYRRRRWRERL